MGIALRSKKSVADRQLMAALSKLDPDLVGAALAMRPDPRCVYGEQKQTALMLALEAAADPGRRAKAMRCVELLIPASDLTVRAAQGEGALHVAAGISLDEALERLLPLCDPKATDNAGETPLMKAAQAGSAKCVSLLVPRSDMRAKNEYGQSALARAVWSGDARCVALTIPGSDLALVDMVGDCLLRMALFGSLASQDGTLIEQLLAAATPFHVESDGQTPLHLCALLDHLLGIVKLSQSAQFEQFVDHLDAKGEAASDLAGPGSKVARFIESWKAMRVDRAAVEQAIFEPAGRGEAVGFASSRKARI